MEKIVHKAVNFQDSQEWDIAQQLKMSSEERQEAAKVLKERFYGKNSTDIRKFYKNS